jgi:glutamyl-Q tRNA(Asp) synthetase
MGSLVTALASFLDVKKNKGLWFIRMDDLDPPREVTGAKQQILDALAAHGLRPDRNVDWQSGHTAAYHAALEQLAPASFYCNCSRKSLARLAVYPGTCRLQTSQREDAAIRIHVRDKDLSFNDRVVGTQSCNVAEDYGDFIIRRRDGLIAYNLATAVDDGADSITSVLRGQDLLHVTAPQRYLMHELGLTPPDYAHIPLLTYADGTKLSKQTGAPPLVDANADANLRAALYYLGMPDPSDQLTVDQCITWGLSHWSLSDVPKRLPIYKVV